jgi:tripartite-type tricarboxylate transporter receptor subunit TctC
VIDVAAQEGQTLLGGSPAEFAAFMKIEMARYQALVKASGMTAD